MKAEKIIDGIPVNPVLPKNFSDTPNEERPASHEKWWDCPYIQTTTVEELDAEYASRTDDYAEEARQAWVGGRQTWMKAWPSGTRYAVRCLDGGAWDRPTCWGMFGTLEAAILCAKEGPAWRNGASMSEELISERRAEAVGEMAVGHPAPEEGPNQLSMEEIDAEIRETRKAIRARKHSV